MSVEIRNPRHSEDITRLVHGRDLKQWLDAGWVKVGRSEEPPTDPEQNAPSSSAPLAESPES